MHRHAITKPLRNILTGSILATLFAVGGAQAGTTFDVIGPHEYDLPVNFTPFNVFVQYAYIQDNDRAWDSNGDKFDLQPGSRALVGLSKYVRFFTIDSLPDVGIAFEVIQPTSSVRTERFNGIEANTNSGFGDTMIGAAIWYKPSANSTLGLQTFLQMPIGTDEASDTNWKNLTSVLWGWQFAEKWNWTGDAGFVFQSPRDNRVHPGTSFHTNNRLSYAVNKTFEPFVGLDYENTSKGTLFSKSRAFDASVGLMVNTFKNQSLTFRYSKGVDGENTAVGDTFHVKYVYIW